MKTFCFTVDDNIRFFKELTEQNCEGLFDHPYLAMLFRLHKRFGVKVQLNLFYRMDGFDLSQMSDCYAEEWKQNSDWLKLSFHSDHENVCPYLDADYEEVYCDCNAVQQQILRFASPNSLAKTTTVHYCQTTDQGLQALHDLGVKGLLGLFRTNQKPSTSYGMDEKTAADIRNGAVVLHRGMAVAPIDLVINSVALGDLLPRISALFSHDAVHVMIHEQYFYEDYRAYQPDFEQKLTRVFTLLCDAGYESRFFEECL